MPDLVLIGAGHTHVQVLRAHAMRPFPARLTLVVDEPIALYSGMLPGLIEGRYQEEELSIDARPLARRSGVTVVHRRATQIDTAHKRIHLDGRPPIAYDFASVNIGSTVAGRHLPGVKEHSLPTRPLRALVDGLEQRLANLPDQPSVAVVGGGAAGVEVAFCLHTRLKAAGRRPNISLIFRPKHLLVGAAKRTRTLVEQAARERGIRLHPRQTVEAVAADHIVTDTGTIPSDLTVWVTGAAAHPLGQDSGLPVDSRGFIKVRDDLRVEGHHNLFAAGDCAVLESFPEVPKAGVYAVREGPVLVENLRAVLEHKNLTLYRAQRDFFALLNLGDGTAVGTKWGVAHRATWMMDHKDRIDRRFMDKFQVLNARGQVSHAFSKGMPEMEEMKCGGCASKVAQSALTATLTRLPPSIPDPGIHVGMAEADDVVAFQNVVQNVDVFTRFVGDAYAVGQVAAQNATSDLWAKGVKPSFAMATVQLPEDEDAERVLFQVMSGIRESLDRDGIPLLGGHTTVGEALTVGLVATAVGSKVRWPNHAAKPGDTLVLTGRLGTGILFHADMAGRARGPDVAVALRQMTFGNRVASEVGRRYRVHSATDITGFGLARHLLEVLKASNLSAFVDVSSLPVLPGVQDLLRTHERSTFHDANVLDIELPEHLLAPLLFDPQTAGGILFFTPEPDALVDALEERGVQATRVGKTMAAGPKRLLLTDTS